MLDRGIQKNTNDWIVRSSQTMTETKNNENHVASYRELLSYLRR